jgi:hypothetical protein
MSKKNSIVNFIIQKLKNKHISLKKYTDWAILGHVTQDLEFTSWTTSCEPYLLTYLYSDIALLLQMLYATPMKPEI